MVFVCITLKSKESGEGSVALPAQLCKGIKMKRFNIYTRAKGCGLRWKLFKEVSAKDKYSACKEHVDVSIQNRWKGTENDPFQGIYIECFAVEQREPTMVFHSSHKYYVIEVRDKEGNLDFKKEAELREKFPGVFILGAKNHGKGVTCDQIVQYVAQRTDWEYASPQAAYDWMTEQGFSIRVKTW